MLGFCLLLVMMSCHALDMTSYMYTKCGVSVMNDDVSCDLCSIRQENCIKCVSFENGVVVFDPTNGKMFGRCLDEFISSDVIVPHLVELNFHNDDAVQPPKDVIKRNFTSYRMLLNPYRPNQCVSSHEATNHYYKTGVVVQKKVFQKYFSNDLDDLFMYIESIFTASSIYFENSFSIKLDVNKIIIEEDDDTTFQQCIGFKCIINALEKITSESKELNEKTNFTIGSWMYLIDAYAPGAGLAYVGTSCQSSYNTYVVSFHTDLVRTVTHELGHIFGALHPLDPETNNVIRTEGGIMGYSDGTINGIMQFDEQSGLDICQTIQYDTNIAKCKAFYPEPLNDEDEDDEDEDDDDEDDDTNDVKPTCMNKATMFKRCRRAVCYA